MTQQSLASPEMHVGISIAVGYVLTEAPPDPNCHGTLSRLDLHHVLLLTDVVVSPECLLKEQ